MVHNECIYGNSPRLSGSHSLNTDQNGSVNLWLWKVEFKEHIFTFILADFRTFCSWIGKSQLRPKLFGGEEQAESPSSTLWFFWIGASANTFGNDKGKHCNIKGSLNNYNDHRGLISLHLSPLGQNSPRRIVLSITIKLLRVKQMRGTHRSWVTLQIRVNCTKFGQILHWKQTCLSPDCIQNWSRMSLETIAEW